MSQVEAGGAQIPGTTEHSQVRSAAAKLDHGTALKQVTP
jgi:hypothetical protein